MLPYLFWLFLAVVLYTYAGYAVLVGLWGALARRGRPAPPTTFEPEVTLVVPAYNEAAILAEKVRNCQALDYPADKLRLLFITDGSTDDSGAGGDSRDAWHGLVQHPGSHTRFRQARPAPSGPDARPAVSATRTTAIRTASGPPPCPIARRSSLAMSSPGATSPRASRPGARGSAPAR